jgi:hypothetical protein
MNSTLILFGIQSIIRLGKIGKDALEQHYRDEEVLFPGILNVQESPGNYVTKFFSNEKYQHYVTEETAEYRQYWDFEKDVVKNDKASIDTLFVLASKIRAEKGVSSERAYAGRQARAGLTLVRQWAPDKGPLSPLARVIISAGDIALEYVGANPSVLGIGGNGEKLLGAFAKNLGQMLPKDGNYGTKEQFGERILCTFLKAGFKVVSENPEWVVKEQHLQEIISETIKPVIKALPQDSILEQLNYEKIADALMGPAATAAMTVLAKNPDIYLGKEFKAGTIAGALTKALINEAAKDGLKDQFTRDGLIGLYQAALGVAVEQPHLFLGSEGDSEDKLCRDLLSNCAQKLKSAPFPYNGDTGAKLASAVMDAVAKNAHNFAGQGKHWEQTAADMIQEIAKDFGAAFDSNQNLKTVFTRSQLDDLGRILLNRVATTPSMIVPPDQTVGEVIKAVAAAMAADDKLLLTGEDWKEILAVAADEAAKNPGRLFKLSSDGSSSSLAADLMTGILKSASDIFRNPDAMSGNGRGKYAVLFGPTLRNVIITVIQNTSGNIKQAAAQKEKIFEVLKKLNEFVTDNHDAFGNKECLRIFNQLLIKVLNGEEAPNLNLETANKLIA